MNPLICLVVVVCTILGGGVQQPFLRTPADGIPPPSNRNAGPLVDWFPPPFNQQVPTSTGAVHKSVTFSCVCMLVQLNQCVVVCGSDLKRGHSGDGCLSLSILFRYERSSGHFFALSWARVRRVAIGSVVSQ